VSRFRASLGMTSDKENAQAVRATIVILAIAGFASTFAGRIVDPLVNVIAEDLGASVKSIALLATAFALPYALIQPVLGPFGDALGKLRVMRFCLAILIIALVVSAFMPDAQSLFVLRVITGMAAGGIIPLALATIGDRVGIEGRQVAITRFLVAVILGQLAGSSLSGLLAESIGWRGVFYVAAAISGVAFLAASVGMHRQAAARSVFSFAVAMTRYRQLLGNPRARALFSLVFVEAIAIMAVLPFIAPLLAERGAGGPTEAGIALAGFAVGGLIYSGLVKWMLRRLGMYRMIIGGGMVSALALVALVYLADWRLIALALMLLGLGFYMMHNSFQTQVTELSSEARGSAVALHACAFFGGAAAGPVIFGYGTTFFGTGATLFALAATALVLGIVAAWSLRATAPQLRAR
jgi:predicted MFS family arabinose efflux permease